MSESFRRLGGPPDVRAEVLPADAVVEDRGEQARDPDDVLAAADAGQSAAERLDRRDRRIDASIEKEALSVLVRPFDQAIEIRIACGALVRQAILRRREIDRRRPHGPAERLDQRRYVTAEVVQHPDALVVHEVEAHLVGRAELLQEFDDVVLRLALLGPGRVEEVVENQRDAARGRALDTVGEQVGRRLCARRVGGGGTALAVEEGDRRRLAILEHLEVARRESLDRPPPLIVDDDAYAHEPRIAAKRGRSVGLLRRAAKHHREERRQQEHANRQVAQRSLRSFPE